MECVTAWLDGMPDTWLRIVALAGLVGVFLAAVGLALGVYQMVTGRRANRLLKEMQFQQKEHERHLKGVEQFLFQKFGERIEIRGHVEAPAAEGTVLVGKRPAKKPSFLLTLRRLLGILRP